MLRYAKKLYRLFRDPLWRARQKYIGYYKKLKLDGKKILLESEHGKKLDGNIFYILRYLSSSEKYKDFKIYFTALEGNAERLGEFVRNHGINNAVAVILGSDEYYRLLAEAKFLINDTSFVPCFIKKPGQVYLNTWHGTPLKTLGRNDAADYHRIGNIQKNFVKSDYLLYPNRYTRDIMLKDYMLENIASGQVILSGYPRNEIFFDSEAAHEVRRELGLLDKRVYVYMPTYRGSVGKGQSATSSACLAAHLSEIEDKLCEDEVMYVNLHPLATDDVDFTGYNKIKKFPSQYEVYEFLSAADVLVTDYSSVFFDFAVTGKKIVLFTYDEEEYLAERGMYMDMRKLPFPRVYSVDSLVSELRGNKGYSDGDFIGEFCPCECKNAAEKLCDAVILGKSDSIRTEPIPTNHKENVFIYTGNLAANGITASLASLIDALDTSERNYVLTFRTEAVAGNKEFLKKLPDTVGYYPITGDTNVSLRARIIRKLFKKKIISAKRYMKYAGAEASLALMQRYGSVKVDSVIQFNGYEDEMILFFSLFDCKKTIFVHNNVVEEMQSKRNHRRDVLKYAYNRFDNVAVVTEDIIAPTLEVSGRRDNIKVVNNTINYKLIKRLANEDFSEGSFERCSVSFESALSALSSDAVKFINIGRFAPEKAQDRLVRAFSKFHRENPNSFLFIIGGYSQCGVYERLVCEIDSLGLCDRVILIQNMPNPHTVLKKCDYFVLCSLYEGFGLVLAEADILGKPAISTDIRGPRTFMQKHGGTLVENSEKGILDGLRRLASREIPPMNVDYQKYNEEVLEQFNSLFT